MAGSFLLCFSFTRLNYLISVFFMTVALLLLYHFIAPELSLIGQRAVDTLIGTLIGAAAGYLFPPWEYQLLAPQIGAVLQSCRRYAKEVFSPTINAMEYRVARREVLVALTTLSASYQRMLKDPVAKQVQAPEVGELVMQCNLFVSEIASLAHIRLVQVEISQLPVFQATAHIVEEALTGTPVERKEPSSLITPETFLSIQQSAHHIRKTCMQLKLPGLNSALKDLAFTHS